MGKFGFQPRLGRGATSGVLSKACIENKGFILAPQVGFEPTTLRLTAEQLVAASRCKQKACRSKEGIFGEIGGSLGGLPEPSHGKAAEPDPVRLGICCERVPEWLFPDRRSVSPAHKSKCQSPLLML
jgi:hypothetical protein